MKKLLVFFVLITLLSSSVTVFASSTTPNLTPSKFVYSSIIIKVNGKALDLSKTKPIVVDGDTYLPIVPVFKAMGLTVSYSNGFLSTGTQFTTGRVRLSFQADKSGNLVDKLNNFNVGRLYELNKVPYIKWTAYRLMNSTVDWFPNTKTISINPYVLKDVTTYFDYKDISKNKSEKQYTEVDLFDRLAQSGLFKYSDDTVHGQLIPIDKNLKMQIDKPSADSMNVGITDIGIFISQVNFDYNSRQELKNILKVCFPTGYNQVYTWFMQSVREEIWEHNWNNGDPGIANKYVNGRGVAIMYDRFANDYTGCWFYIGKFNSVYVNDPSECTKNTYAAWKWQQPDLKNIIKQYELERY
jgi:hypothetical protein